MKISELSKGISLLLGEVAIILFTTTYERFGNGTKKSGTGEIAISKALIALSKSVDQPGAPDENLRALNLAEPEQEILLK